MRARARIAAGVVVVVVVVVGAVALTGGSSGTADKADAALGLPKIGVVAHRVERLRGLKFRYIPKVEVVASRDLQSKVEAGGGRRVRGEAARKLEHKAVAGQSVAALTGILRRQDAAKMSGQGGGSGDIAGVYVPEQKRVYLVREAVSRSPQIAQVVLAHELTHALEDQAFHDFGQGGGPFDDSATAHQALLEGGATFVELLYAKRYLHAPGSLETLIKRRAQEFGDAPAPPALKDAEAFPYVSGVRYVATLYGHGGWARVNAAHRTPPGTAAAILHPDGRIGTDRQRKPRFKLGAALGSGWTTLGRADLGEMDTRELLRVGLDETEAQRGGAGWDAGAYVSFARNGVNLKTCALPCRRNLATVLVWRWTDPGEADGFAALMRRDLEHGLKARPVASDGFALQGGAAALHVYGGRRAALAFAPTLAQARTLVASAANG